MSAPIPTCTASHRENTTVCQSLKQVCNPAGSEGNLGQLDPGYCNLRLPRSTARSQFFRGARGARYSVVNPRRSTEIANCGPDPAARSRIRSRRSITIKSAVQYQTAWANLCVIRHRVGPTVAGSRVALFSRQVKPHFVLHPPALVSRSWSPPAFISPIWQLPRSRLYLLSETEPTTQYPYPSVLIIDIDVIVSPRADEMRKFTRFETHGERYLI